MKIDDDGNNASNFMGVYYQSYLYSDGHKVWIEWQNKSVLAAKHIEWCKPLLTTDQCDPL